MWTKIVAIQVEVLQGGGLGEWFGEKQGLLWTEVVPRKREDFEFVANDGVELFVLHQRWHQLPLPHETVIHAHTYIPQFVSLYYME